MRLIQFTSHLTLALLIATPTLFAPVQAQNSSNNSLTSSSPPKVPRRGDPNDRSPAGTQGSCPKTNLPLTPIIPITDSEFSGKTLKEHPTFIFYVPYSNDIVREGKFMLEDLEGQTHTEITFNLFQTPGFVTLSLPPAGHPLETDKRYRWRFTLYCESQESSRRDFVWHEGWIERVARPNLEAQLRTATLEERLNLYLKNQIWYDISSDFIEIHNFSPAWQKLLDELDIEYLDRQPISGSVQFQ